MLEKYFSREKATDWSIKIVIGGSFILVFFLLTHYWKQSSPNRDDVKLKELQRLIAEIGNPPGVEISSDYGSRAIDAHVYKRYRGATNYEVAGFFQNVLPQKGWRFTNERGITYRKGEFMVEVHFFGEWQYSVDYFWRNPSFWGKDATGPVSMAFHPCVVGGLMPSPI